MKLWERAVVFGWFVAVALTIAWSAQASEMTVEIDTIVRGAPGETHEIHSPVTPESLGAESGWVCDVSVQALNPDSTHPGNDYVIASNGDSVVALDVEASAGKVTKAAGTLTLGGTVTFDVRLGVDGRGISSAEAVVVFMCNPVSPVTTTTTTTHVDPPPVTGTIPPTTTTTEPAPIGGVPTGGGACAEFVRQAGATTCTQGSGAGWWMVAGSLFTLAAVTLVGGLWRATLIGKRGA